MYNFDGLKYVIQGPDSEIADLVKMLITSRPGAQNGSSFAVTSDAPRGLRNVHLSATSYRTLLESGVIPNLYPADER